MKPKKPLDTFELEQPTRPSAENPLRSGRHASFREREAKKVIVEDVSPKTGTHRRHSVERATIKKPTSWEIDDAAAETPRPRVAFTHVPRVLMHENEIVELPLRPRAGFVLGLIDGKTNVQTLVDISGMEMEEVLRVLDELLLFGVIGVK